MCLVKLDKRAVSPHRFPLLRSGSVAIRPTSVSRPTTPSKSRTITPKRVKLLLLYCFWNVSFLLLWLVLILDFCYEFSIHQNREDQLRFGLRLRKKLRENQSSSSSNNNRARANGYLRRCLADAKPRRMIRFTLTWTNIEPEAGFVCLYC